VKDCKRDLAGFQITAKARRARCIYCQPTRWRFTTWIVAVLCFIHQSTINRSINRFIETTKSINAPKPS